jgi:excisionase family DNA binding protein
MDDPKYMKVGEIALILRISKMTVYRLIRDGEFDGAIRIGSGFRVPEMSVQTYLSRIGLRYEPVDA